MSATKKQLVTIRYKTSYGTTPSSVTIVSTEQLTSEHLPKLSAKGYVFLGWVHINEDGHESELSERMIVSTEWLIPTNTANRYYVVFTAKWRNDSKSNGGTAGYNIGDGLKLDVETNTLSVDSTDDAIRDNTQPITSGGVHTIVGNIEVLLSNI